MTATDSILTMTVMKNEGPFMLEWVAWQRVIGVDDILIMTNDCDDGTDAIADRLAELGGVTHVPNPAAMGTKMIGKARHPHIVGLEYAKLFPQWRNAGYVLLCDVDEFPVVEVGDGTLRGLLEETGAPDVISLSERIFGAGFHVDFDERLMVDRFRECSSSRPGRWRARRGVKSLCRVDARIDIRNHRPMVAETDAGDIRWIDGSGEPFPMELRTEHVKGLDVRGRYTLGSIHHYPLRSMESYLVKVARGDAVAQYDDRLDLVYWRRRNRMDEENDAATRLLPAVQAERDRMLEDPALAELHWMAVRRHRAKIHRLKEIPAFAALFDEMRATLEHDDAAEAAAS